jgi:hypothetical protein
MSNVTRDDLPYQEHHFRVRRAVTDIRLERADDLPALPPLRMQSMRQSDLLVGIGKMIVKNTDRFSVRVANPQLWNNEINASVRITE